MAKIKENLPLYYRISDYIANVSKVYDEELDLFDSKRKEMKNQFIVDTATIALSKYEEEYGLDINPLGITTEERRSRIKAKMRSVGTVTKEMVKTMVEAWSNGKVDIVENYNNYEIEVIFIDIIGTPPKIEDVYKAISEIIPAHLSIKYTFKYNKWIDVYPKTWQQLSQFTWNQVMEDRLI